MILNYSFFFFFLIFLCSFNNLILSSISIPLCCKYISNYNYLINCILTTNNIYLSNMTTKVILNENNQINIVNSDNNRDNNNDNNNNNNYNVIFLTFASKNIYNYASYTLLINSYYIQNKKKYGLVFHNEETGDYFPEDRRWNKIGSVIEALDPKNGWAKDIKYVVAIDADLIIMDRFFDVEAIANKYPEAHLILSSDSSDIGNTGLMIIKNSKWSYNFFEMWFETRYSYECDQHAFNDLYHRIQTTKKSKSRIQILPPNEINTEFPSSSTFSDSSSILHLMGEIDQIRYNVFKYAAESVCWNYLIDNDPLYFVDREEVDDEELNEIRHEITHRSIRYGLTRKKFRSILHEQLLVPINEQYSACYDYLYELPPEPVIIRKKTEDEIRNIIFDIGTCFNKLHSLTGILCSSGKEIVENVTECKELYYKNYLLAEKGQRIFSQAAIVLYDHMTRNLYDSFLISGNSLESIETGEKVQTILSKLSSYLPPGDESYRLLLYRRSVAYFQLAQVAWEISLYDQSLNYSNQSLQLAIEVNNPPVPKTHSDYETCVRCLIQAYMSYGDILENLHRTKESKEMYRSGLDVTLELFSETNREKSQINAFINEQYGKLFQYEINDVLTFENNKKNKVSREESVDGLIIETKESKIQGLVKLLNEFEEVKRKYGIIVSDELEVALRYARRLI